MSTINGNKYFKPFFTIKAEKGFRNANTHHFNADPDPAFHFLRIRIPLLVKVMGICDHWSTDPPGLDFESLRLHCERPRHQRLNFEPQKLVNFDFNADPESGSIFSL
jgi:hypothetical protein